MATWLSVGKVTVRNLLTCHKVRLHSIHQTNSNGNSHVTKKTYIHKPEEISNHTGLKMQILAVMALRTDTVFEILMMTVDYETATAAALAAEQLVPYLTVSSSTEVFWHPNGNPVAEGHSQTAM
jgi:hypothetical protein